MSDLNIVMMKVCMSIAVIGVLFTACGILEFFSLKRDKAMDNYFGAGLICFIIALLISLLGMFGVYK